MNLQEILTELAKHPEVVSYSIITKSYVIDDIESEIRFYCDNEDIPYTEQELKDHAEKYYQTHYDEIETQSDLFLSDPFKYGGPLTDYDFRFDDFFSNWDEPSVAAAAEKKY